MTRNSTVKNKTHSGIYILIIIISIICLIFSILIQIEKKQYLSNNQSFCSIVTGTNSCEIVQTSDYSHMLGISNPVYGMIGFTILAILASASLFKNHKILKYLIATGSIIASSLAIWFLYVQTFILHAYCVFCLIVDVLSLVLLVLSIYLLVKHK